MAKKKGNQLGSLRRMRLMSICRHLGFSQFAGLSNNKAVAMIRAARPQIPSVKGDNAKRDAILAIEWFQKHEPEALGCAKKGSYRTFSGPTVPAKDAFYKSWEWRTLRMEVLKEFGAVCQCCGGRPGDPTIGGGRVRICVDHIKPISKYWNLRLERSNLQVLCDECNQGKGAWDETDFRCDGVDPQIVQQLRYVI